MNRTTTFIVGDVHGHFDRLEALLLQEGIIGHCLSCDGMGEVDAAEGQSSECKDCHGDGTARIRKDVTVVQLGDLGDFDVMGSPTGDLLCWRAAYNGWVDIVLWGNHDRALVDEAHAFKGYLRPTPETLNYVKGLYKEGRLMLAYADHGYLMTHAGLHASFAYQNVDESIKNDLEVFTDWINDEDETYLDTDKCDPEACAIRDAIASRRGGCSPFGGILWRDASEKLYPKFSQIFGHTKGEGIREYQTKGGRSNYCIDIGSEHNSLLAGVYLPTMEVSQVNLNERYRKRLMNDDCIW